MKRLREIADDSDALNIVWSKLACTDRYKLLRLHYGNDDDDDDVHVPVFTDSALYRDVLSLIVAHVDVTTWGRMRRVCKHWHRFLQENPHFQKYCHYEQIQRYLTAWANCWSENLILFAARRLTFDVQRHFDVTLAIPFLDPNNLYPTHYYITRYIKVDRKFGMVSGTHKSQRSMCSVFSAHVLSFFKMDEKSKHIRIKYKYEMSNVETIYHEKWKYNIY